MTVPLLASVRGFASGADSGANDMLTETFRALVKKYAVYDIPDEMGACLDCDVVACPDAKYSTCPRRLASLAKMRPPDPAVADAAGPALMLSGE